MTPGGVWDSEEMEIRGLVRRDGDLVQEIVAEYTGTASYHALKVDVTTPGTYEIACFAYNTRNGNTGLDLVTFMAE
ncbi:MAG: hypothetical protein K9K39_04850 [Desulfohalobiaceae bacterium]|nr:hypothetical protein [Desulfohalobiaceae bacterium]